MGRVDVVELSLSALSRRNQKSASGRIPPPSDAPSAGQAADHLGRPAQSSQPLGMGLCPPTARTVMPEIPSRLCSRTQSGGVSVVALETARTTQLLPEHLRAVEPACSSRAQADAPQTHSGDGLLAASATVSIVSILWCSRQRLPFLLVKVQPRQLTSRPGSIPDCRGGNESIASSGVTRPQAPGRGAERLGGQANWRAAT